jgi:hypothetical protein
MLFCAACGACGKPRGWRSEAGDHFGAAKEGETPLTFGGLFDGGGPIAINIVSIGMLVEVILEGRYFRVAQGIE